VPRYSADFDRTDTGGIPASPGRGVGESDIGNKLSELWRRTEQFTQATQARHYAGW
jgi:hypothetical protein